MIHIATVHYKTAKWIPIQIGYLKRYIREPFRVYACLNGISAEFSSIFYYSTDLDFPALDPGSSHANKLNFLATQILGNAADADLIIFLDGDAFPIHEKIVPYVREKIEHHKLAAIRRDETETERQPHASFCATTVGFWKAIKGDWRLAFGGWYIDGKRVTDTGATLLKRLEDNKIDWYPMQRSNRKNRHRLWFGVYDDVVYHHGAGFRKAVAQVDKKYFPLKEIEFMRCYHKHSMKLFPRATRFIGWQLRKLYQFRMTHLNRSVFKAIQKI